MIEFMSAASGTMTIGFEPASFSTIQVQLWLTSINTRFDLFAAREQLVHNLPLPVAGVRGLKAVADHVHCGIGASTRRREGADYTRVQLLGTKVKRQKTMRSCVRQQHLFAKRRQWRALGSQPGWSCLPRRQARRLQS